MATTYPFLLFTLPTVHSTQYNRCRTLGWWNFAGYTYYTVNCTHSLPKTLDYGRVCKEFATCLFCLQYQMNSCIQQLLQNFRPRKILQSKIWRMENLSFPGEFRNKSQVCLKLSKLLVWAICQIGNQCVLLSDFLTA